MSDGERHGRGGGEPPVSSPFISRRTDDPVAAASTHPVVTVTWLSPAGEPPASTAAAPRAPRAPRSLRSRLVTGALVGVGSVVAFALGLWAFNALLMPRLVHGPGEVRVPDLANLTLAQAERTLRASNLLLSRSGERFDASVPRGCVLSQDPPEGTPVRGQRRVMVVISLGAESSTVPSLAGESRRTAELQLRAAGVQLGPITLAPSDDVAEGFVIATDPPADQELPRGARVALLVSTGPGEEAWVMPDLVGRDYAATRRELEALGMNVETPEGSPTVGPIVSQTPEAGTRFVRTTPVRLEAGGRAAKRP